MISSLYRRIVNPGESLKWRTAQGFAVVLFGDAYQNAARLIGNLVMARLLYPEAFGLMLIVNLVFLVLTGLSDAGIKQAIIVKGRDQGQEFLDTAWTLLCVRGAILSVVACSIAWPVSKVYDEPILAPLIIVMSLSSLIRGFSSPHEAVYDRNIQKVRSVILESVSQTLGLAFAIVWLLFYPTIWALVGYGIVSSLVFTIFSYWLFKGEKPSFRMNKEIAKDILTFGKWILFSTALTLLGAQGDKLIVSQWLDIRQLGLFSIAIALAKVTETISGSICWKLLLPVYSSLIQSSSDNMNRQARKVELLLFIICAPLIYGMAVFGSDLINLLYDDRYAGAGWMLQVMSLGALFIAYNETQIALMIAHTNSFRSTVFQFFRVILLIGALLVGAMVGGVVGLVSAIAIAPALFYMVLLFNMSHYNVKPTVQLLSIAVLTTLVLVSWQLTEWPWESVQ